MKFMLFALAFFHVTLIAIAENRPPVILPGTVFSLRAKAPFKVNLSERKYSMDPDGDTMTFSWAAKTPSWMTLSADGTLEAKPQSSHVGSHSFTFQVSDGSAFTQEDISFEVADAVASISWKVSPIKIEMKDDQPLSDNLVKYVDNPTEQPLVFTLLSGPSWVRVTPGGQLSNTQKPVAGLFHLAVRAKNDVGEATGEITLDVKAVVPSVKPMAIYHLSFLVNEKDALYCSLMKRGVDELLIASLQMAKIPTTVIGHRCTSGNQYSVRILPEARTAHEKENLESIVNHFQGSLLQGHEMVFKPVTRIEIGRAVTLWKKNTPLYGTNYGAWETLYSARSTSALVKKDSTFVTQGSYETILGFLESLFPDKATELHKHYPMSDRRELYYGVVIVEEKEWPNSFVMFPNDVKDY